MSGQTAEADSYSAALRAIQSWRPERPYTVSAAYPGALYDAEVLELRRQPPAVAEPVPVECTTNHLVVLRDIEAETLQAVADHMEAYHGAFDVLAEDPYLGNLLISQWTSIRKVLGEGARRNRRSRFSDLSPIARSCARTFAEGKLSPFGATTIETTRAIARWAPGGAEVHLTTAITVQRHRLVRFIVPGRRQLHEVPELRSGLREIDEFIDERRRRFEFPTVDTLFPFADRDVELRIR